MKTLTMFTALGAIALVSACKQQETITTGPADPMANVVANAAPVELPPAIAASKTYRCKDNSVVSIDWYADKKSASLRADPADPVKLTADKEGGALKAEGGYALIGLPTASSITLTRPDKGAQACKA